MDKTIEIIENVHTNELVRAMEFIGYVAICGLILLAYFFTVEYGIKIFGKK